MANLYATASSASLCLWRRSWMRKFCFSILTCSFMAVIWRRSWRRSWRSLIRYLLSSDVVRNSLLVFSLAAIARCSRWVRRLICKTNGDFLLLIAASSFWTAGISAAARETLRQSRCNSFAKFLSTKTSAMRWCLTEKRNVHLLACSKNYCLALSGDSSMRLETQWSWVFQCTS